MSDYGCVQSPAWVARLIAHCTVLSVLISSLVTAGWAVDPSGREKTVRLRVFSKAEVVDRLRRVGVPDNPTSLARLANADGVRVTLSTGGYIELGCDGSVERHEMPSRRTYFDAYGRPFAWYDGDRNLRFVESSVDPELGSVIAVDPNGRYFVTTDSASPHEQSRIYATRQLLSPLGMTPLAGSYTRVFSSQDGIIIVGDAPGSRGKAVIVIVYGLNNGHLVERERIDVPMPDTWFGGWFHAEDATPDAGEILFGFWRDPPLSHRLYVFDTTTRRSQHVSKLHGYHAYVTCDPIAER